MHYLLKNLILENNEALINYNQTDLARLNMDIERLQKDRTNLTYKLFLLAPRSEPGK